MLDALFSRDRKNTYYVFINCMSDQVAERLPKWNCPNVHIVRRRFPNKLLHASIALFGKPNIESLVKNYDKADVLLSLNPHFTKTRLPHLLTIHDLSIMVDPALFSPYQRLWHKAIGLKRQIIQAHTLLSVSKNTKNDLVQHANQNPSSITVLYPGPPTPQKLCITTHCPYRKGHPTIVVVGTRERRKNILRIIDAFATTRKNHPTVQLILIGPEGYQWKRARKKIHHHKIADSVQVAGYADEQQKWELLNHATIALYPSLYEGFGLPVLEAMRAGAPVVTSIGSSLPEAAGNAGLLINPWSTEMIAHALDTLLTNPELRATLQKRGTIHVGKFSWERSAETLLETINAYAHRY